MREKEVRIYGISRVSNNYQIVEGIKGFSKNYISINHY